MKDKICDLWSYLKIFAFRNPETILEQVGVILCVLKNEKKIDLNIEYNEFEIFFIREAMKISAKENDFLIIKEIFFKIPSPKVLDMILSYLFSILKKYEPIEVYSVLIDCYKKEKKIKKNRELALYEFQFILRNSFERRNKYARFYRSRLEVSVLFCYTSLGEQLNKIKSFERILGYAEYEKTREEANILSIKNRLENKKSSVYHSENSPMVESYDLMILDMNNENNFDFFGYEENFEIIKLIKDSRYFSEKQVLVFPFNRKQLENIHRELLLVCEKILIFSREIEMDSKIVFILKKEASNDEIEIIRYIRNKKIETNYVKLERVMEKIFESKNIPLKYELLDDLVYENEQIIKLLEKDEINEYKLKEVIENKKNILNKMKLLLKNIRE